MKRLVKIFCILFCTISGFAQEIDFIGFKQSISYYTIPLSYTFGMNIRKNDFSVFAPFLGVSFNAAPNPVFTANTGASIRYKKFYSKLYADYELYSLGIKPFSINSEYSLNLQLGFNFDNYDVRFMQSAGNKRWLNSDETKTAHFSVWESVQFSAYLLKNHFFYATVLTNLNTYHVPYKNFSAYDLNISIPFQFNYFYAESGFLYNGFYTNCLDFNKTLNHEFIIQKKYSSISKRVSLKEDKTRYKMIHSLELEQRLYLFRLFNIHNSFYVSAFLNGGLGLTVKNNLRFEYEAGFGVGYTFLSSIPFVFQLGINKDKSLIMYLGIVSKITHLP